MTNWPCFLVLCFGHVFWAYFVAMFVCRAFGSCGFFGHVFGHVFLVMFFHHVFGHVLAIFFMFLVMFFRPCFPGHVFFLNRSSRVHAGHPPKKEQHNVSWSRKCLNRPSKDHAGHIPNKEQNNVSWSRKYGSLVFLTCLRVLTMHPDG